MKRPQATKIISALLHAQACHAPALAVGGRLPITKITEAQTAQPPTLRDARIDTDGVPEIDYLSARLGRVAANDYPSRTMRLSAPEGRPLETLHVLF